MGRSFETADEHEFDVDVDDVWHAVATGPGLDGWFLGRSTVEPGLGGAVTTRMGDVAMASTVTAWDPPHHFAFRGGEDEYGRFQAYEFLIEGRDNGSTILRLIASGFLPGDDWEDELEAMSLGGEMFFATLVSYLTHFSGRTARPLLISGPPVADFTAGWARLEHALGIPERPQPGARTRIDVDELGPIDAVVDFHSQHAICLRSDDALYRFVRGFHTGGIMIMHHLFTPALDDQGDIRAWRAWLNRHFA
jgi:uncharacterized protein YndB with AHSA1/START domain